MITIGALFLVVGGVERSHIVDWMARKAFGSEGAAWIGKARMYMTCFCLSIFLNNTPLVAILLPSVRDWGRMRGIAASQLLIPLSYSVLAGSFGSMIGTSSNLTVQGLMQEDRKYAFSFFAPAPIGWICWIVLMLYQIFFGPMLLPNNKSGLLRQARDRAKHLIAEVYVSEHSPAVGKTLGEMMSSLGVAPTLAIKIRRSKRKTTKSPPAGEAEKVETIAEPKERGVTLDREYLMRTSQFWFSMSAKSLAIPARLEKTDDNGELVGLSDDDVEMNAGQAEETHIDIIAPTPDELICADDVVFISSAQDLTQKMVKSIMGESRGLYILRSNVLALPGFGSELVECVLSDTNPFLGQKISEVSEEFSERYASGVITVRAKDWGVGEEEEEESKVEEGESPSTSFKPVGSIPGDVVDGGEIELGQVGQAEGGDDITPLNEDVDDSLIREATSAPADSRLHQVSISDHVLSYGDVILCVTSRAQVQKLRDSKDFFVVSTVGAMPKPITLYKSMPCFLFLIMLALVAAECVEMCPAAMGMAAVFFLGGWIAAEDIPKLVDVKLLMLLATSISFAKSMSKTGLAERLAGAIVDANPSSFAALLLVYAITLVLTEIISNNAAAALMYPVAVALADKLLVSFKPYAMAILIACSAGFMSPIGYQTHIMVWGPGGYKFKDFVIFGFIPDMIYWFLGCALIPIFFPF